MEQTKNSLKKVAKFAGLLYLIPAIIAINGSMRVASKNMACRNTSTTSHALANELSKPRCVISDVIGRVVLVCSHKAR